MQQLRLESLKYLISSTCDSVVFLVQILSGTSTKEGSVTLVRPLLMFD